MIILIRQCVANLAGAVAHQLMRLCQALFRLHQCELVTTSKCGAHAASLSEDKQWDLQLHSCLLLRLGTAALLVATPLLSPIMPDSLSHHLCFLLLLFLLLLLFFLPLLVFSVKHLLLAALLISRFACCRSCLKGPFKHPCSLPWVGTTSGIPTATCLATSCGGRSSWSKKLHSC